MSASPARRFVHTRSIRIRAFARDDGLWDLEGKLADVEARDFALAVGSRAAGDPVHLMRLAPTIDAPLNDATVAKYYPRGYTGGGTGEGQGR